MLRDLDGSEAARWVSYADLAAAWWAEAGAGEDDPTPARELVYAATAARRPDVLAIVAALAAAAPGEDGPAYVGAGPLEDLLSHDGHDDAYVTEVAGAVEELARREPRFAAAVAGLWLGEGVPAEVRQRLARYGASDLTAGPAPAEAEAAP